MDKIVLLKGKVAFPLTLDPSVWIFDDRKVDLDTYFVEEKRDKDVLEEYTKEVSAHWDREIKEGASLPPAINTENKTKKEQMLSKSFGIPFKPFLLNSQPLQGASKIKIICHSETYEFDLEIGNEFILGFSKNGKPLIEDGPLHIYFGDGSNLNNPITNVKEFWIE